MADQEQLRILKQGGGAWNTWRSQAGNTHIALSGVDLRETNLFMADLSNADLSGAHLSEANLGGANLGGADLTRAILHDATLIGANLTRARLIGANLLGAGVTDVDLNGAHLFETTLSNVDLSGCKNLELIVHGGPSTIDIRSPQRSGPLPLTFLRGVGLPDKLIEYLPSLLNQPIQHYSCFISYSTKDDDFARRLHADLQNKGVRCWFAPHDMKIGAKILGTLDEALRTREKVLIVLSEASIGSGWVEDEGHRGDRGGAATW